jgi:DNA (cytosine-5)-methyltransferase 1
VIDLFAGPGGLGEGFFQQKSARFEIAVSIEKDDMAYETLRLRAAYRALRRDLAAGEEAWQLWDYILETKPWNIVFYTLRDSANEAIRQACARAEHEALHLELGPASRKQASSEIRQRLKAWGAGSELPDNLVLIGGPPCQAYSIVGRSRNKGKENYRAEADKRHFLYREYLHVIAEFMPAVFVMENVKGILTSRVNEREIFHTILRDLRRPGAGEGTDGTGEYVLLALRESASLMAANPAPDDFVVRAEDHGVPQARHRVIILGIRKDVFDRIDDVPRLERTKPPSVQDVIGDLPRLRPALSYRGGNIEWNQALEGSLFDTAVRQLRKGGDAERTRVADRMEEVRNAIRTAQRDPGVGADRTRRSTPERRGPKGLADWYLDRASSLLTNHESRAHMPSDLVRYLFVSAFGEMIRVSPRLADFPPCLLPNHKNVDPDRINDSIFKDRFRVQLGNRHSTTVTSHICKDGHAFIHPQPKQCRSLTVREAARLQTFPDSYVFLGNRTAQYTQIGNAVPPLLAHQIAGIVAHVLKCASLAE